MAANKEGNATANSSPFQVPNWAGKAPQGLHLDVSKQSNLIEKLIIDEKPCYLFGRNKDVCDFSLEHTSCSRVHAALVFHKHLNRSFLVDLNSTHGTFIGRIRLEPHKPTQVQVDSVISFGASTRTYALREKPTIVGMPTASSAKLSVKKSENATGDGTDEISTAGLLGLPESDTELDDLTEFHTAHNKRTTSSSLSDSSSSLTGVPTLKRRRRSSVSVSFRDGEEIINPEDIDPSVGRFRNMVQTSVVIPSKKMRGPDSPAGSLTESITKRLQSFPYSQGLYTNLPIATGEPISPTSPTAVTSRSKLSITSAPDVTSPGQVEVQPVLEPAVATVVAAFLPPPQALEPAKKKYAKEAWPGKKPTPALLI